jgi:hypothetical protein
MAASVRQYANLVAIYLFVVAPAFGIHPFFGAFVTGVVSVAWMMMWPVTSFDVALGNAMIAGARRLRSVLPDSHSSTRKSS